MNSLGAFTSNIDPFKTKTWSLSDQLASFSCPYIASTQSTAILIEPTVVPLGLTDTILRTGHILEGSDLTESFLNQALEYFQKALYNFNAQYILASRGYSTWASITNYYSSYFSIFSLLSLQGRAITRIRLNGINDTTCLIHPSDLRNHRYILTTNENRNTTHRLPWNKYYDIYDKYPCLKPQFDIVQKKTFVSEPFDESEDRNTINYKIYEGFQEIIDLSSLTAFKQQYIASISTPPLNDSYDNYLTTLHSLSTDPELKYFARSAIRLLVIRSLFEEISNVNAQFALELTSRVTTWHQAMYASYQPAGNYFEDFVNTFLT